MISAHFNTDRPLSRSEVEYLGGKYSFGQKLRLSGTGSPSMYYLEGIKEFDELVHENGVRLFSTMEFFQKGIIIRAVNPNYKCAHCLISRSELKSLKFCELQGTITQQQEPLSLHIAQLFVTLETGEQLTFLIDRKNLKRYRNYLNKPWFGELTQTETLELSDKELETHPAAQYWSRLLAH